MPVLAQQRVRVHRLLSRHGHTHLRPTHATQHMVSAPCSIAEARARQARRQRDPAPAGTHAPLWLVGKRAGGPSPFSLPATSCAPLSSAALPPALTIPPPQHNLSRTSFARAANLSVFAVSSLCAAAGVMLHTMEMRAPDPTMEFCGRAARWRRDKHSCCVRANEEGVRQVGRRCPGLQGGRHARRQAGMQAGQAGAWTPCSRGAHLQQARELGVAEGDVRGGGARGGGAPEGPRPRHGQLVDDGAQRQQGLVDEGALDALAARRGHLQTPRHARTQQAPRQARRSVRQTRRARSMR